MSLEGILLPVLSTNVTLQSELTKIPRPLLTFKTYEMSLKDENLLMCSIRHDTREWDNAKQDIECKQHTGTSHLSKQSIEKDRPSSFSLHV